MTHGTPWDQTQHNTTQVRFKQHTWRVYGDIVRTSPPGPIKARPSDPSACDWTPWALHLPLTDCPVDSTHTARA